MVLPSSLVLLAYLLPGCAWLCCGCWPAREWKNKRWRCGSMVRAWPCKYGAPVPAWHWRDAVPRQPLPWHWSLASCRLLGKLWRHKKYSSKDSFHPWALIKGWLEPPPCLHRPAPAEDQCSPVPGASPFLQRGLHGGKHHPPSQLSCDLMSDSLSLILFSLLFIIKIKRSISSDKRKSCSRKPWTGQLLY